MQKSFSFSGRASNPAKKKASPAQLAARKKFVEMVRSGAFKKSKRAADRAKNPMNMYTVLHRGTSNIAGQLMASSPKQAKEKIAEKLGLATTSYLMATKSSQVKINPAKKGLYSNINLKRKRIAAGSGEKMRKVGSAGAPTNANFKAAAKTAKQNPVDLMTIRNLTTIKKMRDFFGITTDGLTDNQLKAMRNELIVLGYGDFIPGQLPPKVFYNSMNFATGKVKNNPMEGALLHLYGNKYGQVKQYGNGLYTATILQKVNTGIGEEMDYYDSKEFKTKAGAARWLANSGKKTTRTNPIKRSSRSAVVPNPVAKKPAKLSYVCIAPIEYSGSKYGIDERTPVTLKFSTREMKLAYKCYKLPAVIVQSKEFQEFANDNTVIYMSIAELKTMLRKFIK